MFSDLNILKFMRIGRTVNRVIEAIRAERKGQTNFREMSAEVGEALVEYLADGGVTVVDDKFGMEAGQRAEINKRLAKLVEEQSKNPSPGKQARIDTLREGNLES